MLDEVLRGEQVEGDLDRLIERRADGVKLANSEAALERAQADSRARRYIEAVLWQRLDHHRALIESHTATFEALLRRHRVGLRLCEEALGIANEEGEEAA